MEFSPISPTPPPGTGGRRSRVTLWRSTSSACLHLDGYRTHASNVARWYGAAAKRDPEAADHNRALLFPNGFEVPQDPGEALRWSRAAAEQGIADAQANTGLIYARGIGCERDYQEARHWYSLAAAQGSAAAELGLGILYANGHGVETDLPTAAKLVRKGGRERQRGGASGARANVPLRPRRRPRY